MSLSISSILSYLNTSSSSSTGTGSSTSTGATSTASSSSDSALAAALALTQSSPAQELVSLGTSTGSSDALTYNAQGLLSSSYDPLLSDNTNGDILSEMFVGSASGSSGGVDSNLLNQLLTGSTSSATSTTGTTSSDGTSTSATENATLAEALKQNPALAATIVQTTITQGIVSILS